MILMLTTKNDWLRVLLKQKINNDDDNGVYYFDYLEKIDSWWWLSSKKILSRQKLKNINDWRPVDLSKEEIEEILRLGKVVIE